MSEKMIRQFMEMVRIPSESGNEAAMIQYLKQEFDKLGGKTIIDPYGNLVVKFPAKACARKPAILFSCHADTVMPGQNIEPILENGVIRSNGETILGADDKAGIAELLEALRQATVHPPLEIAISRQEEIGLLGVKNLDFSLLTAKEGYLLDNDTLDTIVIGGPSYFSLDVAVKGRAAHAGMEPEKGINAIYAAARAISRLRLGRLDAETTANVGVIQGGIIRNGVPDSTAFLAECRSLIHEKAQGLADEMEATIRQEVAAVGAQVEIKINNLCRAVNIPADARPVQIARQALRTVGIDARTTLITGFTDASIYNNKGIEMAVVGIGARAEHSCDEHIFVEDMEKALKMILEIFRLTAE